MKLVYFILTISFACLTESRGVNGGFSCAVCTVVFGMADQLAEIHNETLMDASLRLCYVLPTSASKYCVKVIRNLEPILINPNLEKIFTPDVICYGIRSCHRDPGSGFCHLFPEPDPISKFQEAVASFDAAFQSSSQTATVDFCSLPGLRELCWLLEKSWTNMDPVVDVDGDSFSLLASGRGSNWRGRDCRDFDRDSYPGRKSRSSRSSVDDNCNGVYGMDPVTGRSYEDELCDGTGERGVIFIGDSVGAHFHFPEAWMNPALVSWEAMHNYTEHILDELDWPQLGFATGFTNTSEPLLIQGVTDSIYLRMRSRNRCNHRDYQNLSRNGASSFDLVDYVMNVARNQSEDKPALVVYAAFGNDVCNMFKDTVANMTTPHQFRKNVLVVLNHLDHALPNGSHVLLIGLVDGGRIFPTMADRLHPLGQLRKDVHYRDVFSWFSCMEIGPCVGWMNANTTLRKLTSKRAMKLSKVLKDISVREKFTSLEISYLANPLGKIFNKWIKEGKQTWQLIDPIDSLHPSQLAQPEIADSLWKDILHKFPQALGDVNPHNDLIQELFKDQGGH